MEPVAVAYVPVLHQGYKKFFHECAARGARCLFLLGSPFTDASPELQRDLRALSAEEIERIVQALPFFSSVKVLSLRNFPGVKQAERVFLPDETVSRGFAKKYLLPGQAEFLPIFLRWDMKALSEKRVPEHHRTIPASEFDREVMGRARDEAKKSPDWWRQIGTALVRDGEVLFTAHNAHFPQEQTAYVLGDPRSNFTAGEQNEFYISLHAEAAVVARAARSGTRTHTASLYATTFPCPACARMIIAAGITRLYYTEGYSILASDELLAHAGIEVVYIAPDE